MSEPTEADRQKAWYILPCQCGAEERHLQHSSDCPAVWRDLVAEAIADAHIDDRYAEGHAAGRREMREEAAHHLEQHADSWAGGGPQSERQRKDAELIRALPDHPETKDKGQ